MGSDLAMNPPAPAQYRAEWKDNICIVERRHEMEHKGQWHEVWRGVPTEDVKRAFEAMRFHLPRKPRTPEEQQAVDVKLDSYIQRLEQDLTLRDSYAGDPDPGGTKMLHRIVPELKAILR